MRSFLRFGRTKPARPVFDDGGEGGEGGSGGGEAATLNLEDPKVKAAVDSIVAEAVDGLKRKNQELLGANRKVAEKLSGLEGELSKLGDLDQVKAIIAQVSENEEAALLAAGKWDEVLNRRTEAMRQSHDKEKETFQTELTARDEKLAEKDRRIAALVIGGKIREAASKLGVVPSAFREAERDALEFFTLDENENPVRVEDEAIVRGKDGKSPLGPAEWLENQKGEKPHWWPPSAGGGATGSGEGRRGSADADAVERMSSRDKLAAGMKRGEAA